MIKICKDYIFRISRLAICWACTSLPYRWDLPVHVWFMHVFFVFTHTSPRLFPHVAMTNWHAPKWGCLISDFSSLESAPRWCPGLNRTITTNLWLWCRFPLKGYSIHFRCHAWLESSPVRSGPVLIMSDCSAELMLIWQVWQAGHWNSETQLSPFVRTLWYPKWKVSCLRMVVHKPWEIIVVMWRILPTCTIFSCQQISAIQMFLCNWRTEARDLVWGCFVEGEDPSLLPTTQPGRLVLFDYDLVHCT